MEIAKKIDGAAKMFGSQTLFYTLKYDITDSENYLILYTNLYLKFLSLSKFLLLLGRFDDCDS